MNKKFEFAIAFIAMLGFSVFCAQGQASAATKIPASIMDKAVLQGVYKCYQNGSINPTVNPISSYTGIQTLIDSRKASDNNNLIPLVTGIGRESIWEQAPRYNVADSALSCRKLFEGSTGIFSGSNKALLPAMGHSTVDNKDSEAIIEFMKNMGYAVTTDSDAVCYSLKYSLTVNYVPGVSHWQTNGVCQYPDGTLDAQTFENLDSGSVGFNVNDDNEICLMVYQDGALSPYESKCAAVTESLNPGSLLGVVRYICGATVCNVDSNQDFMADGTQFRRTIEFYNSLDGVADQTDLLHTSANFIADSSRQAGLQAIRFLSDQPDDSLLTVEQNLAITPVEKRMLYQAYLASYYKVNVECGTELLSFDGTINWMDFTDSTMKTCYYTLDNAEHKDSPVNGVGDNGFFQFGLIKNLNELLTAMDALPVAYTEEEIDEFNGLAHETIEGASSSSSRDKCQSGGAAGALGWIVCPILEWMGNAVEGIYEDYLKPQLKIDPVLFTGESNEGGTRQGWEAFRNFANIAFVIVMLAVIFSQLTGVGIDNYGIKRILPKLIVAAVLVNLSYLICELCVDFSNILGNGLQEIFNNLPPSNATMPTIADATVSNPTISADGATTISGVLILTALVGMVGIIWTNPAVLLSLLVSALGVVIAIFFVFVLLAAREAAIVVMVVISPLAFTCYMLPNTKNLFDRWRKISTGLLLVYPICGLLIGGGDYVSRLLLSAGIANGGFVQALTAMLVGIVPLFFIPKVLQSSFNALGNLGAMITGVGQRFRGATDRTVRNSDVYKRTTMRMNSGTDRDGNLTTMGRFRARVNNTRFGRLIGADRAQARAIATSKKDVDEGKAAAAQLTNALSGSEIARIAANGAGNDPIATYYGQQFEAAARSGNTRGMDAAIAAAVSSGYMKDKDIAKMIRTAENRGNLNFRDNAARSAWMRDMSAQYGNGFLSTDFELKEWMRASGGGANRALGNYGEYANGSYTDAQGNTQNNINIDDIKPEDLLKLSGDSLAGMIASGRVDQSMAQRVMAMNPNMSADKRIMLGAAAAGAIQPSQNANVAAIAASIKSDATTLMNNASANTTTIRPVAGQNGQPSEPLANLVRRWTAPTSQRTTIVQEFFSPNDSQARPVDVDVRSGGQNQNQNQNS